MDIDTFEFFVHWLYHQRLPNGNNDPELCTLWDSGKHQGADKMGSITHLYIFCDKYDVPVQRANP
ncbi:hypothetical protein BU25DRAFT_119249 [Macroventuria anomochaeta]|uniref:Uncharacterized protein n=1 Tax=Macroventuria anomochaeta TaxID=301207 RepID=A0ACB6RTK1_9PLEO|nr:uncharacterized protein BU25DRAFT_119249 [Macroventuria anomochaeta]KAF2625325.1 hypothetical protein BU25DRAFT_119249 [Macroventuria anomochaeta]